MTQLPPLPAEGEESEPTGPHPTAGEGQSGTIPPADNSQSGQGQILAIEKYRPWVTWTLIAACSLLYLVEVLRPQVVNDYAFVPLIGYFEPWRFLSSAFLHSAPEPFHLAFNMWALYVVGQNLELILGRIRYLALYLSCALAGSLGLLVYALLVPQAWLQASVGASGAVFGLFGATLAVWKRLELPLSQMIVLIGLNLAMGFVFPGIAWQAHLGGLLCGFLLGGYYARGIGKRRILSDLLVTVAAFAAISGGVWLAYRYGEPVMREVFAQIISTT